MSKSSKTSKSNIIADLFNSMNFSPASQSHSKLAEEWLKSYDNYFTSFVSGKWVPSVFSNDQVEINYAKSNSFKIEIATAEGLESAAQATSKGFEEWQTYNTEAKSKILRKIAQAIEKESKLFKDLGNLTPFGSLREKHAIPYLINSFNYCAGLVGDENLFEGWNPTGFVCVIENPSIPMMVSPLWQISSLLAAGNAVLFLMHSSIDISAYLLAELCVSAGLPPGVFNVVPCNNSTFSSLPKFDKILLNNTNDNIIELKDVLTTASKMRIPCEYLLPVCQTAIIYESADLDAALNSILDMLIIKDGKESNPVCVINVQESILKRFVSALQKKICHTLGDNAAAGNPPFYIKGSEVMTSQLKNLLSENNSEDKVNLNVCASALDDEQDTPVVILNCNEIQEQDKVNQNGPGIFIEVFRTVKESIQLFNTSKKAPDVSIWAEEMFLTLEVAHKLKSKTVWINSQNVFDPSIAYGNIYLGGNSIIGGKEGLFSHMSVLENDSDVSLKSVNDEEMDSYGEKVPSSTKLLSSDDKKMIKKNFKLFIGGSFIDSSEETVQISLDSENKPHASLSSASKSDIDKAVSAASSSQVKWESLSKIKRAGILHKASDLLNSRKEEFIDELCSVTGLSNEDCSTEVNTSINMLFYWGNYIIHVGGQTHETTLHGKVFEEHYPLGVIGIQCSDSQPLLSFISLITPAIAFGNAVVAIASEKYPTPALLMCEVLKAAGLSSGILNVIWSSRAYLTRHLCSHLSIDALWYSEDGDSFIYNSVHEVQPKRIFNCKNLANKLNNCKKLKLLYESTYSKAIYMPMGTGYM